MKNILIIGISIISFTMLLIIILTVNTIHSNLTNQTTKVYVYNTKNDYDIATLYYTSPQDIRVYICVDGKMIEYVPKEVVKENE